MKVLFKVGNLQSLKTLIWALEEVLAADPGRKTSPQRQSKFREAKRMLERLHAALDNTIEDDSSEREGPL